MNPDTMTAAEAAAFLGVSKATLYAYVSRGLVPVQKSAGGRESRYGAEAVRALKARRDAPRGAGAARESLDFGQPVIESAITLIEDGRLYYRGLDVEALAEEAALEDVAELIWGERLPVVPAPGRLPAAAGGFAARLQGWLAWQQGEDPRGLDRSTTGVCRSGAAILDLAARAADAVGPGRIHQRLARAWGADAAGADLIRAALVVSADHELNASTFAARVVASTAATPYAAILAALAALSGPYHGGMTYRVAALFDEIGSSPPADMLAARLRRGEDLPGFGHRLYPKRDPRAALLLDWCARRYPQQAKPYQQAAEAGQALTGQPPSLDFGLQAVCRVLRGPADGAFQLFAIGRTVGWIGHVLEQYRSDRLLRPRASYTGPRPLLTS